MHAGRSFLRALLLAACLALTGGAAGAATSKTATADHEKFRQLAGPFDSGPEVTKACLYCHTEAA